MKNDCHENIHSLLCSSKTKDFPVYQHTFSAHSFVVVVDEDSLIPVALMLLVSLKTR